MDTAHSIGKFTKLLNKSEIDHKVREIAIFISTFFDSEY